MLNVQKQKLFKLELIFAERMPVLATHFLTENVWPYQSNWYYTYYAYKETFNLLHEQ